MHSFVYNFDRSLLEVVAVLTIFAKNTFMRPKRKKMGATVDLKKGRSKLAMA